MEQGGLKITSEVAPLSDIQFQPASVELRLGNKFVHRSYLGDFPFTVESGRNLEILPGMCLLATTLEEIHLPNDIVAIVDGKSTWGRTFLIVHSTAGYIDPGFKGEVTLEVKNIGEQDVIVTPGDRICQLRFFRLDAPALRPYGHPGLNNHYYGQQGPTLPHGESVQ